LGCGVFRPRGDAPGTGATPRWTGALLPAGDRCPGVSDGRAIASEWSRAALARWGLGAAPHHLERPKRAHLRPRGPTPRDRTGPTPDDPGLSVRGRGWSVGAWG